MESNITPLQFIIFLCGCAYIFYLLVGLSKASEKKDNEDDLEHMGFV